MKTKLLLAGLASVCASSVASATVITESNFLSPVSIVDSSFATDTITVSDSGSIIDLNIWIDFTKSGDWIDTNGDPTGTGFTYNSEIVFSLIGPDSTQVDLILSGDLSGQGSSARATFTFDDSAATAAAGLSALVDGTYQPNGSLADFNGLDAAGTWTLYFADTVGRDPLSLNAWGLEITTAGVPDGGSTGLILGVSLLGLGALRRMVK